MRNLGRILATKEPERSIRLQEHRLLYDIDYWKSNLETYQDIDVKTFEDFNDYDSCQEEIRHCSDELVKARNTHIQFVKANAEYLI